MKLIEGGIMAPLGFVASSLHCGIKRKREDLALIYSEVPAVAAGLFTTNRVKAAPVKLSKVHLKDNRAQAILINSGNANSCTGKDGLKAAKLIAKLAAFRLGISKEDLLVASTGIMGRPLPAEKIVEAIPRLVERLSRTGGRAVARAIMTTDKSPKEIAVRFRAGGRFCTIGAIAKGAGMIAPGLATMLAFITTDVDISKRALIGALKGSIEGSFNRITIDGDMSTNDTVIILANGMARNQKVTSSGPGLRAFQRGLDYVTSGLAKQIVKGGEGVTKFIEVVVKGASTPEGAKLAASKIANSPLVKTMVGGGDPNWGRIVASLGASGAEFDENGFDLWLGNRLVLRDGTLVLKDLTKLRKALSKDEAKIALDLKVGRCQATVWTGDLTEEYVRINAKYSTW